MANDPQAISTLLSDLIEPQARGRLLARGLARGILWRNGILPEGAPPFAASLTADLLDFGYGVLALALELRDANRIGGGERLYDTAEPLRVAAEAIESAVRRDNSEGRDQGRHLVVSATAFHLAGYAARSFSMLPLPALETNLSTQERSLALLLRRDVDVLREHLLTWNTDARLSDDAITARLLDTEDDFGPEDATYVSLTNFYQQQVGLSDSALVLGDVELFGRAVEGLQRLVSAAASVGNLATWWVATLTLHLIRDLWSSSLHQRIPGIDPALTGARWVQLRQDFISVLGARCPPQLELWPSQLDAASRAANRHDDLVIALPTSAGKTRIAELCILRTLADTKRVVYVTPLRALSAQVERLLSRTFIPLLASVTSLYGAAGATIADAENLANANIVVATPEKLDFALRQDPDVLNDVGLIVFDEGHMIGLGSREIRYEALVQRLLRRQDAKSRRIVCLSAMFNSSDPYFADFTKWLRDDEPGAPVQISWRPTRQRLSTLDWNSTSSSAVLRFRDDEKPFVPRFLVGEEAKGQRSLAFPKDESELFVSTVNAFAQDKHTVLVYCPVRRQTESLAKSFLTAKRQGYGEHIPQPNVQDMDVALAIGREWLGKDHPAFQALSIGIGVHHGALPRPFLSVIEALLDKRKLGVVIASPTLAQGLDLSCSVLVFRSLKRYENGKWKCISPAEFSNVLGRVGRAFVDIDGIAVLPTFDASKRAANHKDFSDLIEQSSGQQLISGLAQLVVGILNRLISLLGVDQNSLLEYVLNAQTLWDDPRLSEPADEGDDSDDDVISKRLTEELADLDVALLSTIEPLDSDVSVLADILDQTLSHSLWKRSLAHHSQALNDMERALLNSRARWLWERTTTSQRMALYSSGLGAAPGLFLQENQEVLIESLASFHLSMVFNDPETMQASAVRFAEIVFTNAFFKTRKLPDDWQSLLKDWLSGKPFSESLAGRGVNDGQKVQNFIQDGVSYKLVWAAEAARVQAITMGHPRALELGEGPALALSYGVDSISAALLCQVGFPSRVAALSATQKTNTSFTELRGLHLWMIQNEALLSRDDFWSSPDHSLLWKQFARNGDAQPIRNWKRVQFTVPVVWNHVPAPPNSRLRIIPNRDQTARICDMSLRFLGTAALPFNCVGASLKAESLLNGQIAVSYYGAGS